MGNGLRVRHLILQDNSRGVSHGRGAVRHVAEDNAHRTDFGVMPDPHSAQDLSIRAEIHAVAKNRDGTVVDSNADRDTLSQSATRSHNDSGMNKDATEVPDSQTWTDCRFFRETDGGQRLHESKAEPVKSIEQPASKAARQLVDIPPESMHGHSPDRLFTQPRTSRVTLKIGSQCRAAGRWIGRGFSRHDANTLPSGGLDLYSMSRG